VPAEDPGAQAAPPRPTRTTSRQRLTAIVGAVVSLGFVAAIGVWISRQSAPEFPDSPGSIATLGGAIALFGAIILVRGWRWHRILRFAGVPHARRAAVELTTIGYMGNTILPARGGEALRIVLLTRGPVAARDARTTTVIGTVLTDRLLDVVALVIAVVVVFLAGTAGDAISGTVVVLAGGAVVLGAGALLAYEALRRAGRFEALAARVRPVATALKLLLRPVGVALLVLTVGIWFAEALVLTIVTASLGVGLDPLEALFCVCVATGAGLIPSGPGYLGTFDAALLFALRKVDVTGGAAVGLLLLYRFVVFVPVTVAGLVLIATHYGGLRQARRRAAAGRDADDAGVSSRADR
jgi:uncharacterized membrane protein YbhN (UPF0104 family)